MSKPFNYGGQAVLEGVMMRGSRHMAVAVRAPYGFSKEAVRALKEQYPTLAFDEPLHDVTSDEIKIERDSFKYAIRQEGKLVALTVKGAAEQGASDVAAMKSTILRVGALDCEALAISEQGTYQYYGDEAVEESFFAAIAKTANAASGDLILIIADIPRIVMHEEPIKSPLYNGVWSRMPFVRGLGLLWDSLGLGVRALNFSADVAMGEEAEFGGPIAWGTMAISFTLAIGLFFLLPAAAADGLHALLGIQSPLAGNIIEGIIRLTLIIAYIWGIGRIPDIQRLFQYHGAEHKAINAYEDGAPLTPESVQHYPLEHPRCGTGFLLVVMVVSILVFSLLGRPHIVIRLLSRVVLIPVIAGISYEYIRLLARNLNNPIARVLVKPQLALQRLTTRQPSLDMLEVSLTALKCVLEAEHIPVPTGASEPTPASAA